MLKEIRLDMEMYCDCCVIEYTDNAVDYGNTLLNMAQRNPIRAAERFSDLERLKKRIIKIADYSKHSENKFGKTAVIIVGAALFVAMLYINTHGGILKKTYIPQNNEYIELSSYFKDIEGCFILYDTKKDIYFVYNKKAAEKRSSPNSTYKIALALDGLENEIISPESNEMQWRGEQNPFEEWNRNHNLNSAMAYSVNWYFQAVDGRISHSGRKDFLNKVGYGNQNTGWNRSRYWLENSLEISPVEQVNFLKGIYNNEFGLKNENISAVLSSMYISDGLYGKTGTGNVRGKNVRGWFVGIAEESDNRYFFAVELFGDNADGVKAREITIDILNMYF